jgi:hypothetical protein
MIKKALLIGIYYNNTPNIINSCINNINEMNKILNLYYGFNIEIITDDTIIKPTKKNIINALKNLINTSDKCEEILIYFSCHGWQINDKNNDEVDGKDEVIVPLDYKNNGYIIDDELNLLISQTKCHTKLLFDCSHGGSIIDLYRQIKVDGSNFIQSYQTKSIAENNKYKIEVISGCDDNETALDGINRINNKNMGVFTTILLYILKQYNYNIELGTLLLKIALHFKCNNLNQNVVYSSNARVTLDKLFFNTNQENNLKKDQENNLKKDQEINLKKDQENNLKKEQEINLKKDQENNLKKDQENNLKKDQENRLQILNQKLLLLKIEQNNITDEIIYIVNNINKI